MSKQNASNPLPIRGPKIRCLDVPSAKEIPQSICFTNADKVEQNALESGSQVPKDIQLAITKTYEVLHEFDPHTLKDDQNYRKACTKKIEAALENNSSCIFSIMSGQKVVLAGNGYVYLLPYLPEDQPKDRPINPCTCVNYNESTFIEKVVCFQHPFHPNVYVHCYVSTCKANGDLFDLGLTRRKDACLTPKFCDKLVYWLLELLCMFYQHGIAHFDIKPDNIVFDEQGAYAIDFAFAEIVDKAEMTTKHCGTGIWVIDPHYSKAKGKSYSAMHHQTWCFAQMIWWWVTRSQECDDILSKYHEKQEGSTMYENKDFQPFKVRFPGFAKMLIEALAPTEQAPTRPLPDDLRTAFKTEFKSQYDHEPLPANFNSFRHSIMRKPVDHK